MPEIEHSRLVVGESSAKREIAVAFRQGRAPGAVWFGGFRSDMGATKATALDSWAAGCSRACLRFDYSGHGRSGGAFEDGTIGRWLDDALASVTAFSGERPIFVGSSMGAWIALLAARRLRADGSAHAPSAAILIAPAVDFTEDLMWNGFTPTQRDDLIKGGMILSPSEYGNPYPITRELIEDGRHHLMLGNQISPGCPVHIVQGMADPDVPWRHTMRLVEQLPADDVQLTLVKDGDHRLSRPQDLDLLRRALDGMADRLEPAN